MLVASLMLVLGRVGGPLDTLAIEAVRAMVEGIMGGALPLGTGGVMPAATPPIEGGSDTPMLGPGAGGGGVDEAD